MLPEDYLVSDLGAIRLKDILFHDLSREGADIEQQDLKGGTSRLLDLAARLRPGQLGLLRPPIDISSGQRGKAEKA